MPSQCYCGLFDQQMDAQVAAGHFQNHGFQVSGPTQYDFAELDALIGGKRSSTPAASTWLVIATAAGAASNVAKPAVAGKGGGKPPAP